jgi:plastocyanin
MNKALLVLFMILLQTGAASSGIEVRNATTVWNATIVAGSSTNIPDRITVEYSNIIYISNLMSGPDPDVQDRIMVDHANIVYNSYMGLKGIAFVDIRDNFFNKSSITVPVNTEVTWINFASAIHTVTADDGGFNSGNLVTNQSFTHNFTNAGTYLYHCSIHPFMTGSVIVTQPLLLIGDLNNNGVSADAGDLVLMKRASIGEIVSDFRYDLNDNGIPADAGDLVLMKRASIGEIKL